MLGIKANLAADFSTKTRAFLESIVHIGPIFRRVGNTDLSVRLDFLVLGENFPRSQSFPLVVLANHVGEYLIVKKPCVTKSWV